MVISDGNKFNKTKHRLNYFIIIVILAFCDSPFFVFGKKNLGIIVILFLFLFAIIRRKKLITTQVSLVILSVWLLLLIQWQIFGGLNLQSMAIPIWNIYMPYLVYTILGLSFFNYLLNTVYFVSIYTSVIWLLQSTIPGVNSFIARLMEIVYPYSWADWPRTIFVYSMPRKSGYFLLRNSGAFHEPGAFSIYLILAIIINTIYTKNGFDKKNVIMFLIILTTFSTTGYILMFILIAFFIVKKRINILLKLLIILVAISISVFSYRSAMFLEEKIESQYITQTEAVEEGDIGRGRFFSFLISWKIFKENIVFGKGISNVNPILEGKQIATISYGFMGILARYGILWMVFYMFVFYKGIQKLHTLYSVPKYYGIVFYIVLHLSLSTQAFFYDIPFVFFFIIGLNLSELRIKYYKSIFFSDNKQVTQINPRIQKFKL